MSSWRNKKHINTFGLENATRAMHDVVRTHQNCLTGALLMSSHIFFGENKISKRAQETLTLYSTFSRVGSTALPKVSSRISERRLFSGAYSQVIFSCSSISGSENKANIKTPVTVHRERKTI